MHASLSQLGLIVVCALCVTPTTVPDKTFPLVAKHGGVYPFPEAPHQPRDGTKICVDMTAGSEPGALSPAIEKLARYLNIYAGAGKQPASLQLAVILHGEATLKALSPQAYAARYGSDGNPNLPMIKVLQQHGVKFYVCGQSLLSLGAAAGEVASGVEVAVSALTTNVNLQQDGFQIITMH